MADGVVVSLGSEYLVNISSQRWFAKALSLVYLSVRCRKVSVSIGLFGAKLRISFHIG